MYTDDTQVFDIPKEDTLRRLCISAWGVVVMLLMLVIMFTQTGCGSTTGWNFTIGVNPVNYVADQQGLQRSPGAIIPVDDKRRY